MKTVALLRRGLAITEFAVAGLFLLLGVDSLITKPTRANGGGDGLGGAWFQVVAVPVILSGAVLAATAFMAWKGQRRWWMWQAALPAFWVVGFIGFVIYMIVRDLSR